MKDLIRKKQSLIIVTFLAFSFFTFKDSFSMKRPAKRRWPAEYLFAQQLGEGCSFLPMLNLAILNDLSDKYDETYQIPENKFVDRRTWFGEGYFYNKVFHDAFRKMMLDRYKNAKNFINECIERGPLFPHVYDKNGNFIFADDSTLLKFPMLSFAFFPTFLYDRRAMEKTTFYEEEVKAKELDLIPNNFRYFPVVQDKNGKYYKYVRGKEGEFGEYKEIPSEKVFDEFFDKQENFGPDMLGFKLVAMDFSSPHLTLVNHEENCQYHNKNYFGGSTDCYYVNNCAYYSFYNIGTYRLMLLRLGLDEKNKKVSQDLKRIFNEKKEDDLWSDKYFNKDFFLEYHLSQIFKDDRELFNQAMKAVDFYFPLMETYNDFFQLAEEGKIYRDKAGIIPYTIEVLEKFLPDKEQMLAYNIMLDIMMLWYGAMNEKAFYKPLVEPSEFKEIIAGEKQRRMKVGSEDTSDLLEKDGTFKNYKECAYKKGFIDLWKSIVKKLRAKDIINNKRLNFVNYSSHGNVVSFDKDIHELQNEKAKHHNCDMGLLNDLGVAFIESDYSDLLPSFYKFTKEEMEELKKKKEEEKKERILAERLRRGIEN